MATRSLDIASLRKEAIRCLQTGDLEKSAQLCSSILESAPKDIAALHISGIVAAHHEDHERALQLISQAADLSPNNQNLLSDRASTLFKLGRFEEATEAYLSALNVSKGSAELLFNLGNTYFVQHKYFEAKESFQGVLENQPSHLRALTSLGKCLIELGEYSRAATCLEQALAIDPRAADTLCSLGNIRHKQGNYVESIVKLEECVKWAPESHRAWRLLGRAHDSLRQFESAIECYKRALEIRPDFPTALVAYGRVLFHKGKIAVALEMYKRALEVSPGDPTALMELFYAYQHTCSWGEAAEIEPRLDAAIDLALAEGRPCKESAHGNLSRCMNPARNLMIARSTGIKPNVAEDLGVKFHFDRKALQTKRLRIGYISADFRKHVMMCLMGGLFAAHDRKRVEVFAYSYGQDDRSPQRARIMNDSDSFLDVRALSDQDVAQRIYDDEIDILVDLQFRVGAHRPKIQALRPAPIQAAYLRFAGSSGLDHYDYLLTDKVVSPPEHSEFYSETLAYLPHCYQINDNKQSISGARVTRRQFGIPEDAFVFFSFNRGFKIEPVMFDLWMRILKAVPNSILWLWRRDDLFVNNLYEEAERRGVPRDRLVFAGRLDRDEHMARLQLADLGLDTRIYNGHTTTSDALWAGVPVLTLRGSHFASRVSASILAAHEVPELITETADEFFEEAVRLASDKDAYGELRSKVEANRYTAPLFDTQRSARDIETAYQLMWERYIQGLGPAQIEVPSR